MGQTAEHPAAAVDTRSPAILMWVGMITGAVGFFFGFARLFDGSWADAIVPVVAISVGAVGVIAFVRHSVFHRGDAARMGWDMGRRNDFQIEVGFANLAWGITGLLSWLLSWGTAAQGAITLIFGLYMLQAAGLHVVNAAQGSSRGIGPPIWNGLFAAVLLMFAIGALVA